MKRYRQYLQRLIWSFALLLLATVWAVAQPTVATKSATNVLSTTATLNATINTNGAATTYMFAYGTSKSYNKFTTITSLSDSSGTQNVSAEVSNLSLGTTYHFCIIANHKNGSLVYGNDMTFTTAKSVASPTANTLDATDIESDKALLNGQIIPNGLTTRYYFEYGTSTAYGNTTTIKEVSGGVSPAKVSTQITGLSPQTTYYFRLNVANTQGKYVAEGKVFSTKQVNEPEPEKPEISVSLTPDDLSFGNVEIGSSKTISFVIANNSNVDVSISNLNPRSSEFSFDWTGGVLRQGETKTVSVTFTPTQVSSISIGTIVYINYGEEWKEYKVLPFYAHGSGVNPATIDPDPGVDPEPSPIASPAYDLIVELKNGSYLLYHLTEYPMITYTDADMVVFTTSSVSDEYQFSTIKTMKYKQDDSNSIQSVASNDKLFISNRNSITFIPKGKDMNVNVVSVNGVVVKQFTVRCGKETTLPFDTLAPGAYIININGVSHKINVR